jgi:hypothetical protein
MKERPILFSGPMVRHAGIAWRSSLHMFRWASRITLEVLRIGVERVESISEADAVAEGFASAAAFLDLFYNVNERAPKGSNPWVWVVGFRVIAPQGGVAGAGPLRSGSVAPAAGGPS